MCVFRWALPVLMLIFGPQYSCAQSNDWALVKQILPGQQVKVVSAKGKSYRGVVQTVTDESIQLEKGHSIQKLDVRSVLFPKPEHRGRNTLVGAAVGAVGGLVLGEAADAQDQGWFRNAGKEFATPLFAVVGLGIGALWPTGGWREVYSNK